MRRETRHLARDIINSDLHNEGAGVAAYIAYSHPQGLDPTITKIVGQGLGLTFPGCSAITITLNIPGDTSVLICTVDQIYWSADDQVAISTVDKLIAEGKLFLAKSTA